MLARVEFGPVELAGAKRASFAGGEKARDSGQVLPADEEAGQQGGGGAVGKKRRAIVGHSSRPFKFSCSRHKMKIKLASSYLIISTLLFLSSCPDHVSQLKSARGFVSATNEVVQEMFEVGGGGGGDLFNGERVFVGQPSGLARLANSDQLLALASWLANGTLDSPLMVAQQQQQPRFRLKPRSKPEVGQARLGDFFSIKQFCEQHLNDCQAGELRCLTELCSVWASICENWIALVSFAKPVRRPN